MWKQDKPDGSPTPTNEGENMMPISRSARADTGEDVSAFVGKGVDFKGTIVYQGTVRIDGTLDGEVQTEGVLLVGEEAVLKAKVTAGTIVCKGKITGDITAKEKIKLRAPAVIEGGVTSPMISIEEGVLFNGTLEMTQSKRDAQKETTLRPVSSSTPSTEQGSGKRVNG